ncbi:MAG: alpha/beta hydrolase [Chitinophagaceae bacterium]|nr:alpha/beta hydrolase [Chitinophagaceae bacterium]MEA3427250.1 alpha/beta hydrolase [Bacteroidota bacterium]MCA6451922.1 alpha/beta hydrolase [Chitinophagaceae bacterium]MCA6455970.1 alpha/beta hydrolase [Chitinophagaceae bacterium]MCA6460510.1 alpha/beta hydrolase [Chitinophagaceae bacterium]
MRFFFRWIFRLLFVVLLLVLIAGLFLGKKDIPAEQLIQKYGQAPSQFMELMGMRVHYRDEGDCNDTVPLVLIHGTSSSLFTWDSTVLLLGAQHRIIRFDLPGFALTGPQPERDYSMALYTRFVDSVLLRLGVAKCVLGGNSLGGSIVWQYAVQYPAKVQKLILVDAGGYVPKERMDLPLGFRLAKMPVVNNLVKWITPKQLVRKSVEDVYGNKKRVSDDLVNLYSDMTLRAGNRQALIDRMQLGLGEDASAQIRTLSLPTLIVWGDQDRLIPPSNATLFHRDIRGSELHILKGIGHVPMEEAPQDFVRILAPFLAKPI